MPLPTDIASILQLIRPRQGGGALPGATPLTSIDPALLAQVLASSGQPPPAGQPGQRPTLPPSAAAPLRPGPSGRPGVQPTLPSTASPTAAAAIAAPRLGPSGRPSGTLGRPQVPGQTTGPAAPGGDLADILASAGELFAAPQGGQLQPPAGIAPPAARPFDTNQLLQLVLALSGGAGGGQLPTLGSLIGGAFPGRR